MWRKVLNIFSRQGASRKRGFGLVEVMVSVVVLGFLYVALNKLQTGNHEAFLRIRGRDGAVEVAQQVLDSLKSVGAAALPSKETSETTVVLGAVTRSWERGLGGTSTTSYTPTVIVGTNQDFVSESGSLYTGEGAVKHIVAKQVRVKVSWQFKGSEQSIEVSGVVR